MRILREITEVDVGVAEKPVYLESYKVRRAARGILVNDDGQIALLDVSNKGFYKLPGGGIEGDESIEEGYLRELVEETGCEACEFENRGVIFEYRNEYGILQFSYVFFSKVKSIIGEPKFMEDEIEDGFKLMWVEPLDALDLVKNNDGGRYGGKFMVLRDGLIISEYLQIAYNEAS